MTQEHTPEVWRPVVYGRFPFGSYYECSSHGFVRRMARPGDPPRKPLGFSRTAKLVPGEHGYVSVMLYAEGFRKRIAVSRLVLWTFIGPPPEGGCANHKNSIKDDNRIENLEWTTFTLDKLHHYRTVSHSHRGENHTRHKLTEEAVRELRRVQHDPREVSRIAEQYGVGTSAAWNAIRYKSWKCVA